MPNPAERSHDSANNHDQILTREELQRTRAGRLALRAWEARDDHVYGDWQERMLEESERADAAWATLPENIKVSIIRQDLIRDGVPLSEVEETLARRQETIARRQGSVRGHLRAVQADQAGGR